MEGFTHNSQGKKIPITEAHSLAVNLTKPLPFKKDVQL